MRLATVMGFQIHAARAGREAMERALRAVDAVSIHAPRAGRDVAAPLAPELEVVSIHAPRAGRDASGYVDLRINEGFNPRAPRGARRGRRCTWNRS